MRARETGREKERENTENHKLSKEEGIKDMDQF